MINAMQILVPLGFFAMISASHAQGTFMQLFSPSEMKASHTIDFEGYADYTTANTLYQSQGITISRDDGQKVYIFDGTSEERDRLFPTSSGTNIIGTVRDVFDGDSTGAFHLNITSLSPLYSMGAFFGNDQDEYTFDFTHIKMSIFNDSNDLLGEVTAYGNLNRAIDQFIGIRSTIAFTRIRFENLNPSEQSSQYLAVMLDDLTFEAVPEPSTFALLGLGILGIWNVRRKSKDI